MFLEIREKGKSKKYYLVHTYRIGKKVNRISRYLGSNISQKDLSKLKEQAKQHILEQIKEHSILNAELTSDELNYYKKLDNKINIEHLQSIDWLKFTEVFTYNTNAIEGSTVSLSEVKGLVEKKELPIDDDEIETINVSKAIDFIRKTKEKISLYLIKEIHKICFDKTKHFAGKFRDVEVVIRDKNKNIIHQGAPYKEVSKLLNELINWYYKHDKRYPPLLLAAVVHNQFEKIHPFQDGNGRVGRILLNYVLIKHKYPPINIRLKDRINYYECLQSFDKTGDINLFIRFLIKEYRKQYR